MLQTFTGGSLTSSPGIQAAVRYLFQGDVPSAINILCQQEKLTTTEREAFIAKLAREAVAGKILTVNSRGETVKAVFPPNSIIGILRTVEGKEKERLANLFLEFCSQPNLDWPGTRKNIFLILGRPADAEKEAQLSADRTRKLNVFRNRTAAGVAAVAT